MTSTTVGSELARSLASKLLDCSQQLIAQCDIERSFLLAGQGADTDFTGGAAGFEVASTFLSAAARGKGWNIDLASRSTCDPCLHLLGVLKSK